MLPSELFQQFLLLLPLKYPSSEVATTASTSPAWDYDNTNWGENYTICDGTRQSPINLKSGRSLTTNAIPLKFMNYNTPLGGSIILTNNGHSLAMTVPDTVNGRRPAIYAGLGKSKFEAESVYFHWGSSTSKGSEHKIDNKRFDMEMHIVHKNVLYDTVDEAVEHQDGFAVLGVMFEIVDYPNRIYPGLNKIFNKIPYVVNYTSTAAFRTELSLGQLLGDLNTKEFFTYKGSLTTPPCSEAVIWHVFPDPLPIPYAQAAKFWKILDSTGNYLLDNYRPLQDTGDRSVFYKVGLLNNPKFLQFI